jgi:predicted metalloendopeptidase
MASAQDDFYKYANSWWLDDEKVVIPPEYPRWGGFIQLHDESLKSQVALLQEVATLNADTATPDEAKLGMVWAASLKRFDDWKEGKSDYTALVSELKQLSCAIADNSWADALAVYMSRAQRIGIGSPFAFDKEANLNDSNNIVLDLSPAGGSLPSRDYYLDSKYDSQRAMFLEHLTNAANIIQGAGATLEDDFATRVLRFETKLAMISMKSDQSRMYDQYFTITTLDNVSTGINDLKAYVGKLANYADNTVDTNDCCHDVLTAEHYMCNEADVATARNFLERMFTELKLREVMTANYAKNYDTVDADAVHRVMVFDGDFFRRVFKLLCTEDAEQRKDITAYFQYKIIRSGSSYCSLELDEEFFDFYSRKLGGQSVQKSPEKRSTGAVNSWVGELLGKIYVSRFFSEQDKKTVHDMVSGVLQVMERSLRSNDWLTQETKDKALVKLAKFTVKIGYPDKWKNYDLLHLDRGDSLFELAQKVQAFEHKVEFLERINSVKDRTKWEMTPQTVNAYFHPLNNEIVFPAAILQPPFYTKTVTDIQHPLGSVPADYGGLLAATNFGGIAAVIAHEITHGYDDQGRKFDSNGNIQDWWQPEDAKLFASKTTLMTTQAEKWTINLETGAEKEMKEYKMNAALCMGENLADLGGLSLAAQAMEFDCKLQEANATDRKLHYEAFYRSWANIWRSKQKDAYAIRQLATDPHAPTSFRGNLVNNIDSFYEAFDIPEGCAMYVAPEERVKMW